MTRQEQPTLAQFRDALKIDVCALTDRVNGLLPTGEPQWTPGQLIAMERRLMHVFPEEAAYLATALGVSESDVRNATLTEAHPAEPRYKIKTPTIEITRDVLQRLQPDVHVYLVNERQGTIATGPVPPAYTALLRDFGARVIPDTQFDPSC